MVLHKTQLHLSVDTAPKTISFSKHSPKAFAEDIMNYALEKYRRVLPLPNSFNYEANEINKANVLLEYIVEVESSIKTAPIPSKDMHEYRRGHLVMITDGWHSGDLCIFKDHYDTDHPCVTPLPCNAYSGCTHPHSKYAIAIDEIYSPGETIIFGDTVTLKKETYDPPHYLLDLLKEQPDLIHQFREDHAKKKWIYIYADSQEDENRRHILREKSGTEFEHASFSDMIKVNNYVQLEIGPRTLYCDLFANVNGLLEIVEKAFEWDRILRKSSQSTLRDEIRNKMQLIRGYVQ